MKYIKTLVSMAVCGVVMALAVNASAQSSSGSATIVRIQGEARYSTGDNVWHPLEVGAVLRAGAIIQTAAGATVDIVLGEKKSKAAISNSGSLTPSSAPTVKQNIVRMWEIRCWQLTSCYIHKLEQMLLARLNWICVPVKFLEA